MDRGPLDARRIRDIGNWGRASEHIGRHWEEIGVARLPAHLRGEWFSVVHHFQPSRVLAIMTDPGIQGELSRLGLPNPDVVLAGLDHEGGPVLQALDFKWAVEFASYRQIRAEGLRGLLAANTPLLRASLTAMVGDLDGAGIWRDGVLFSPDSPSNRRFLRSAENRRQEYPIEETEVLFEPVDGPQFFSPLPGWDFGERLAQLDRAQGILETLEGAEKYYRLGAGLLGGLSQIRVSIFAVEVPSLDTDEALAYLRQAVRVASTLDYLRYVEKTMILRQQNLSRLQALTTSPYRFAELVADLADRGIVVPDRQERGRIPPERWRWIEVHRQILAQHRAMITKAARRMIAQGKTDPEVLSALEVDNRRLAGKTRALAQQLIDEALAQGPAGPMTVSGGE